MIEKMCDFNLTFVDFVKMFELSQERFFEVISIITYVSAIKKSVFLEEKKKHYKTLKESVKKYYKKYNINDVEKIKDMMFLKRLYNESIMQHKIKEIETFCRGKNENTRL